MIDLEKIQETIPAIKKKIQEKLNVEETFKQLTESIKKEITEIKAKQASDESPVPVLNFNQIKDSGFTEAQIHKIKKRGCLIIKGVFPRNRVEIWNQDLEAYLEKNNYLEKQREKAGLDTYFSTLKNSKPQIYGVYWSKPQMEARTSEELAVVRSWLNRLWKFETDGTKEFDPDKECIYADRVRQREPGDDTLGLSPHIDGGSIERWLDPSYQKVYRHVLSGDIEKYDPFDATWRTKTEEIPSPAVCSMFRTFQGWTALTKQGAGDGTLNIVPIARAMAWVYLRALQPDIADNDLCSSSAGKAMVITQEYHSLLLDAYVPIPTVEPGDTVWWHSDVIHGVEAKHQGKGYSNVIYIGAAPDCEKNRVYLKKQRDAFEEGNSPPDFAAENYEIDFEERFMPQSLSSLGKIQMGYT